MYVRDLTEAVREAATAGAAFVRDAISPEALDALMLEVGDGPFTPMPEEVGVVRQQTESLEIRGHDWRRFPATRELRDAIVAAVRASGVRGAASWRPNEADVQRYQPGWLGITPHLDGKKFRRLVAAVTLEGTAPFAFHETREGPPVRTVDATAGSIVLLRGPGLDGHADGRPFHAVGPPGGGGARVSLGLRMHTSRAAGG